MKYLTLFFIITLQLSAYCLEWEETKTVIKTASNNEKKMGVFKYKNTSNNVVVFKEIKASCGCVLVEKPESVQPGESGIISFKAPVPRAGGQYQKTITIETDEEENQKYLLILRLINTDKAEKVLIPVLSQNGKRNSTFKRKIVDEPDHAKKLYTRPVKISARGILVEKILAKQALLKKGNYIKQDECPFLPLGIIAELYHDWNGLRIYTCCEQCLEKVRVSPYHAIIKLAEKGQTPIEIPIR
ncbi:MAG: DUF1573 domain-containing protein [Lentisphaerales bacterium]|nr:DUF1573 domain-containing protein [Lentisphaerales bacterium]